MRLRERHVEWDIVLLKAHATFNNVYHILVCWFWREAFVKPLQAQIFYLFTWLLELYG